MGLINQQTSLGGHHLAPTTYYAMQMLRRAFLIGAAATFGRVGWGRVKQTNAGFDIHKAHQNTSIWHMLRCDMQNVICRMWCGTCMHMWYVHLGCDIQTLLLTFFTRKIASFGHFPKNSHHRKNHTPRSCTRNGCPVSKEITTRQGGPVMWALLPQFKSRASRSTINPRREMGVM